MKTLKQIDILRQRIQKHNDLATTPQGFVAVGHGSRHEPITNTFGISSNDLYCYAGGHLDNDKSGNVSESMYYVKTAYYEDNIRDAPESLVGQITKAQGLIGKSMMGAKHNKPFVVKEIRMFNDKFGVPTWFTKDDRNYLTKHGYMVIAENDADYANVGNQDELTNVVTLNDEYNAIIEGNTVKVGCQSIPIAKVEEIVELYNKLNA